MEKRYVGFVALFAIFACSRDGQKEANMDPPDAVARGEAAPDRILQVDERAKADSLAALRARFEPRTARSQHREIGLQLRATCEIHRTKDEAEVRIHWELDYLGPRPPLIILRPSLSAPISTQTIVEFYPVAVELDDCPIGFSAPAAEPPSKSERKDFLKLTLGEVASGTITVKASEFWQRLRKRWPKHFGMEPRLIFVKLIHAPLDRGEHWDLDAWTGTVSTNLMEVRIDDLKPPADWPGPRPPRPVRN